MMHVQLTGSPFLERPASGFLSELCRTADLGHSRRKTHGPLPAQATYHRGPAWARPVLHLCMGDTFSERPAMSNGHLLLCARSSRRSATGPAGPPVASTACTHVSSARVLAYLSVASRRLGIGLIFSSVTQILAGEVPAPR